LHLPAIMVKIKSFIKRRIVDEFANQGANTFNTTTNLDPRQRMSRRRFIGKLSTALKMALGFQLLPRMARAATETKGPAELHYRPLNGDILREMARRKMHHGPDMFLNPMGVPRNGRFWQVLSWKLFHKNAYAGVLDDQPISPVTIDWEPIKAHRGVSVTLIKHSTLLIKDVDRVLLVDPVFDDIFWFIKDFSPRAFSLDDMPRPDHVLITHGHYDHLDGPSLAALDPGTNVISPLGYDREFKAVGMTRRTRMDWYDRYSDGDREITFLPANHWTMRNPIIGPNRSLWGGYLIKTAGGPTIYISGDSAYFDGFDQLADDYDIDLAIFNMGAYAPRWFMAPSHMNPAETVRAFQEIKARRLMIAHWGTFQLGDEPVYLPPADLKRTLENQGLLSRWIDLGLGQTHFF
jgi:L-ascorbate metabolism protein UlaG (beta-lactamase superfamily)